ncbi:MAG TPA: hypothetical protein DCS88_14770 [Alphaproteobacteria bacterium]|nr:hypothetical protein [Alphaproteobacteria bacterium]
MQHFSFVLGIVGSPRRSEQLSFIAEETMKRIIGMATIIGTLGWFGGDSWAFRADDLTKLVQTNQCRQCDLSEADLSGVYLAEADLRAANLREANLTGANLWRANLKDANLVMANLTRAHLARASLNSADLSGANLTNADLSMARLQYAWLQNTRLTASQLSLANLYGARLQGADFSRAAIRQTDLRKAKLDGAVMRKMDYGNLDKKENSGDSKLDYAGLGGPMLSIKQISTLAIYEGPIRLTR